MAVDANLHVLDLLFDDQDGVLSKEVDDVPPLDFVSIDLLPASVTCTRLMILCNSTDARYTISDTSL